MTTAVAKKTIGIENAVHKDEFLSFVKSTDQRFSSIDGSLDKLINKIDTIVSNSQERNKPNYSLLLSVCGFVVILVGMGASLIGVIMNNNAVIAKERSEYMRVLSDQGDRSIADHLKFVESGNNIMTKDDFRYENEFIEKRFLRNEGIINESRVMVGEIQRILEYHLKIDKLNTGENDG